MQESENMLMRLINRKQFTLAALIGGPLIAGFIAAHNFWRQGFKWKSIGLFFIGLLLSLAMEALMMALVFEILLPMGLKWYGWYGIPLFGTFQVLFYFIINQLLRVKRVDRSIFPDGGHYYGRGKSVVLLIVSLGYFLMHVEIPMLLHYFPNMVLLIYLVPHTYFFNRVRALFNSDRAVVIGRWVVVLIAIYMPLAFMIGESLPIAIANIPLVLAEYYIYILLYLFLFSLTVELLGFLLGKSRMVSPDILNGTKAKLLAVLVVFTGLSWVLYYGSIRYNDLVINEYSIEVPKKNAKLDALKIAFVADMHLNENTGVEYVREFVEVLKEIKPDIVLTGGDMVEGGRYSLETIERYMEELRKFRSKYGGYSIGGNHDYSRHSNMDSVEHEYLLTDTIVKVAESFWLIGLQFRSAGERPVKELLKLRDEDLPVFLLDHAPYNLNSAYDNGVDVQLSGHTHYGQVWPLNYLMELLFEVPWGYKKIKDTHFFVTSGIQGWGTPIRTAGQSEIIVINVKFI